MSPFRRSSLRAVAACVTLAVLCLAGRGWLDDAGRYLRAAPDAEVELARLGREGEELDHLARQLTRCVEIKYRATRKVIDRRLGLLEAAAQFHAADAWRPLGFSPALARFPGGSDGERECRQVIAYVEVELEDEPSRRDAVVDRLEAELRDHLRRHGTVHLPDTYPPRRPAE